MDSVEGANYDLLLRDFCCKCFNVCCYRVYSSYTFLIRVHDSDCQANPAQWAVLQQGCQDVSVLTSHLAYETDFQLHQQ